MMVDVLTLTPRPVARSIDELLVDAVRREPFLTSDSKSGSAFERVTMADGSTRILKHVHVDWDWTMRFNGDVGCHPAQVWASGLMDVLPERIDHGVVGVAAGLGRAGLGAAILMRDLSDAMVPPGDDVLPLDQHLTYIDDLAALSARTLGWRDDVGLVPIGNRWTWFNHASLRWRLGMAQCAAFVACHDQQAIEARALEFLGDPEPLVRSAIFSVARVR